MNAPRIELRGAVPVLYLEGYVGVDFTAASVRDALEANPGRVTVELNSGGGFAFEGISIFHVLSDHPGGVDIIVTGLAASAASVIFMAGRKRSMRAGAMLMIHDPSADVSGKAEDLRRSAGTLDKLSDSAAEIYANRTKISPARIKAMMDAETWFTADEAVKAGFADEVLSIPAAAPVAFAPEMFKHAPAELLARNQRKDTQMPEPVTVTTDPAPTPAPAITMNARDLRAILALCDNAKVSEDERGEIVVLPTFQAAADRITTILADRDRETGPVTYQLATGHNALSTDNPSVKTQGIEGALYARMTGKAPEGPASEFVGMSLLDLGRMTLQARGIRDISKNRDRLATQIMQFSPMMAAGHHTTSDFPSLLTGAGQRVLLEAYQAAASVFKTVGRVRNSVDFRPMTAVRLGEAPQFDEVPEGAEVKYGTRSEEKESYRIKTFGKLFSISRQAIINDDLNAFADINRENGKASAETECAQFIALLATNSGAGPTMDDGKAAFHTGHGNLASGAGAPSIETLSAGKLALAKTKGVDGKTLVPMRGKYLVVPAELEDIAATVLATINPATVSDVNPHSGKLELLVEPRLSTISTTGWYIFSDPSLAPVLEYAYLNGTNGPVLETREGWNVLGAEFRAILDFGCGFIGWRGAYRNAGG